MKGYKATDKDLRCRGFQFELGKWYEHDGEVIECKNGFHFCEQPSGPWAYYSEPTTRIFEIEAEGVLDAPFAPGADFKRVAKRIKLVREIINRGDSNTGNSNTGNCNTGHHNTGDRNTGDWNTGNRNTGYCNTGYHNTGDGNTGNRNTGNSNTGHGNTGHSNTGDYNVTSFSGGFFCTQEARVSSFDVTTKYTKAQFMNEFPEADVLGEALMKDDEIDIAKFKRIPNITKSKLKKLHDKFKAARA